MGAIPIYLIQMALPALVGVLLWGCAFPWRQYRLSQKGFQPAPFREGMILLFFMFMAGLFALTLTPANFWRELFIFQHFPAFPPPFQGGINLIPIRESLVQFRYYLKIGYWEAIWINYPGNIIMFSPIGFFTALLMDKPRWWKSTGITFLTSLFIEVFQLFVSRGTDIDDLILNTLGGLLGYWLFLFLRQIAPSFIDLCARHRKGSV